MQHRSLVIEEEPSSQKIVTDDETNTIGSKDEVTDTITEPIIKTNQEEAIKETIKTNLNEVPANILNKKTSERQFYRPAVSNPYFLSSSFNYAGLDRPFGLPEEVREPPSSVMMNLPMSYQDKGQLSAGNNRLPFYRRPSVHFNRIPDPYYDDYYLGMMAGPLSYINNPFNYLNNHEGIPLITFQSHQGPYARPAVTFLSPHFGFYYRNDGLLSNNHKKNLADEKDKVIDLD